MGILDTFAFTQGLHRFSPKASSIFQHDYEREPDFSLSWDDNDADTVCMTENRPPAIHLVCQQAGLNADGSPAFGTPFASDDANLALSEDGYLINGAGHFLLGVRLDEDGHPVATVPEIVHVNIGGIRAIASTRIYYQANLPSYPLNAAACFDESSSELLTTANFARDPSAHGSGTVLGDDRMKFIDRSLSGGSVKVFTQSMETVHLVFRWAKLGSVRTAGRDYWNLFYRMRRDARAGEVAWKNIGHNFIFGADGRLEEGAQSVPILDMLVDGLRLGNMNLTFGDGITQFADRTGLVKVLDISADGRMGGEFNGISLSSRGRLFAHYSNTPMSPIADIHFTGDESWFRTTRETPNGYDERRAA
jgi:flagellar hook protein FlgE